VKLGFIGTGTITSAIVRGLGTDFLMHSTIHLSPRSADIANALAGHFPNVHVGASNQAVLDASDVVMVAVRPQIVREVLADLQFRANHHVISLVATVSLETMTDLIAPARNVVRAVPLPAVAFRRGPTAIFPPDAIAAGLFNKTGLAIQVDKAETFDALSAVSSTMASYFAFAGAIASWLTQTGLPAPEARKYVASIFEGLASTAADAPGDSFDSLATGHATLGGLNEQLRNHLEARGLFADVREGLDDVLARVRATSLG
jgi:pyrroline-5-carboxylate reductase